MRLKFIHTAFPGTAVQFDVEEESGYCADRSCWDAKNSLIDPSPQPKPRWHWSPRHCQFPPGKQDARKTWGGQSPELIRLLHFQKLRLRKDKPFAQAYHTGQGQRDRGRVNGPEDAAPAHTHLIHGPTAWEEVAVVMAMKGNVEHTGVLVESLLCAVAMVNIL